MIKNIWNGLKRLLFGPTSVFVARTGSGAFNGASFVTIHRERAEFPLRITGIQFSATASAQGDWRICVDGEKVFPFSLVNPMDDNFHSLIPIEVAAGSLLEIEIKSRNQEHKGVAVLSELDVVEMR